MVVVLVMKTFDMNSVVILKLLLLRTLLVLMITISKKMDDMINALPVQSAPLIDVSL